MDSGATCPLSCRERVSHLCVGRLLFGSLPDEALWTHLVRDHHISLIVSMVPLQERHRGPKCPPPPHVPLLRVPVTDQSVPSDTEHLIASLRLASRHLLHRREHCVFVHCKGGHGRSALFSGLLFAQLFPFVRPHQVIHLLTLAHRNRVNMRARYAMLPCPTHPRQRRYVRRFVSTFSAIPLLQCLLHARETDPKRALVLVVVVTIWHCVWRQCGPAAVHRMWTPPAVKM